MFTRCAAIGCGVVCTASVAHAGIIVGFLDPSGLSAEAEFTLLNPTTLEIRLRNLSVGAPNGFSNSDQILTGVSWDFGHPGYNGDTMITSGTAVIGPNSQSVNFDTGSYGPGTDLGGEWGYGNMDGTGAMTNFISGNTAQATPFGGLNLDGPVSMDGPQGGLVANPPVVPLGGLGAISDEIISTLNLSLPTDYQFLFDHGVRFEFGSDAFFIDVNVVPAPGTALIAATALVVAGRRRR